MSDMFSYLSSLRDFNEEELEVCATICAICDKYDELYAQYLLNPTEKLLEASRKIDQLKFETCNSIGIAAWRCNFSQETRHIFCNKQDLLAQI
jgi:hypothetical protein